MDGVQVAIEPSMFTPMPKVSLWDGILRDAEFYWLVASRLQIGKVEFDFSGSERPWESDVPSPLTVLQDSRLVQASIFINFVSITHLF